VINDQPTGMNINYKGGSEVVRAGRGDLIPCVLRESANFGVAFDGDADRAVFVSEKGALVDGDYVLYILGKYLNSQGQLPGSSVVTTEMANAGLGTALEHEGIRTIYTKVGDKYVVREMVDHGYRVGGEQSGHIIILDEDHTTGDGIYTALYLSQVLLEMAQEQGTELGTVSLSKATEGLVKLPQVIASARVSGKPPLDQVVEYHQELARVEADLGEGGIINTRFSGTEPLLRVMIQGQPGHSLEEIANLAIRLCRSVQKHTGDLDGHIDVKDCTTGAEINLSSHGLVG
jgi:phosphoglucosamine mutase